MMELPWWDGYFHGIVDVFSSFCLDETYFSVFFDEVYRTLARGGQIFFLHAVKEIGGVFEL